MNFVRGYLNFNGTASMLTFANLRPSNCCSRTTTSTFRCQWMQRVVEHMKGLMILILPLNILKNLLFVSHKLSSNPLQQVAQNTV
ncbi:hypothetical protein GDO86_016215 [Hymenochirus boettgeri]|uniref:Uncharacterized protein n=1 Tax=Hymenochirus boettgeri TaxID=247094 RepID=A0A8T2K0E3_9PIPI|nr:hypothetical protein GDO86_016215 [Hymenochirus boettgeri]